MRADRVVAALLPAAKPAGQPKAAHRCRGVIPLAAALVLAGTYGEGSSGAVPYDPAPCPNPIVEGAPQYDLGSGFECGYLTVPENRERPNGRSIRIPVARLRAQSPTPKKDPIVFLAGGPGGSGLLEQSAAAGWNADRDVIFISQRGTLKAEPFLSCPEIDEFTARSAQLVMAEPATSDASARATRACRERLAGDGWDLSAYNTTENAADVADLRIALGIDEWNVYGVSYGTNLALQLLRDHPEGIRTLVLDGVVPPQITSVEVDWSAAARGYRALFDACANDRSCNSAFPKAHSEFTRLVNDLADRPRSISVEDPGSGRMAEVVVDGYKLANLVVRASSDADLRARIPAIVHDLATGTGAKAAAALLPSHGTAGIFGYGLQLGVQCHEYVPRTSQRSMLAAAKKALPDFPDSVLSLLPQTPYVFSDCAVWNVGSAAGRASEPARSDIPVLLVSGAFDGITPPGFAEIAARSLPRSRQLVFPGAGHAVFSTSPECFRTIMEDFLNQLSDFDTGCLSAERIPPFETS
ncbi:alpha/beta hydrolase [Nonomuraea sp. NPDC059194]|uniref:alpha/beta hydrolase n=1 Tax=Nonomuraea sp. NPDC059194 TaxID=3346764 RepID=UPI00368DC2A5